MLAQLRPIEAATAGDEHEHVVVLAAPDHDRAQQRPELDALQAGALLGALARSVRTVANGTPDSSSAVMAGVVTSSMDQSSAASIARTLWPGPWPWVPSGKARIR